MNNLINEEKLGKKPHSNTKFSNTSVEEITKWKHRKSSNRSSRRPTSLKINTDSLGMLLVHCSCERLQNELIKFIDEFISSKEYRDYVNFKASIIRKDEEAQYDINDLHVKKSEQPMQSDRQIDKKHIDLTKKALRVFFLERQIEKYASNIKNAEILQKQQEAIRLIRAKIAEVKSIFFCHRKQREEQRKAKQQSVVNKFRKAHNIDVSRMLSMSRLDHVILNVERKLRMKRRRHKNNIKCIVEKLVKEYKQKRSFQRKKRRVIRTVDIKRRGIFHLKGKMNSLDLISSVHIQRLGNDKILEAFKEAGVCIEEKSPSEMNFSKKQICNSEELQPSSHSSVKEGFLQSINSEIMNEEGLVKLYLDDYANQKLGIIKSFIEFENTLEARHFFCLCEKERKDKEMAEIAYPDDTACIIKPKRISFKNFRNGKIYRKQIVLINMSGNGVKVRLLKIYTANPGQAIYFELETDEMKVARPGLPLKYTLIFKPAERMDLVSGYMVFLICNKLAYYRSIIPIECVPSAFNITIEPINLSFGTIPIWKFQKQAFGISKIVKVKCEGTSQYKIVVKKVVDPFELNSDSSENEHDDSASEIQEISKSQAEIDVETIISDILLEVDSDFRIDKRFLKMDAISQERQIEVSLSGDKHPGFFVEKYQFDVYEINNANVDEYRGMQEITLTLEISDYPIKCDPPYVDFGICFFNVAYQMKFSLTNVSSSTQQVTVKIPSSLSYYVSTDEKKAFVRSEEIREVTVKFLPSGDLLEDKNKFYDPTSGILSFPIQVKLLNKQYVDAPPLMQQTYAIMCDCTDLKLGPINMYHYNLVDERMILDMGDCSVNETVVTQIKLRNPCCSTIYYCFKSLPKYITIMPNYGIGSIEACQEIDLKIYIHPQLDDFEGGGMDPEIFNEEKHLEISVNSLNKIGKYRRKPDIIRLVKLLRMMLKELRETEDTSILEDICVARCTWKRKMIQCACKSIAPKEIVTSKQELDNMDVILIESKIYEYSSTFQQLDMGSILSSEPRLNNGETSDVSSIGSRVTLDLSVGGQVSSSVQTSKKKKRKHSKRKVRGSSMMQSIRSFISEPKNELEKTDVPLRSTEIALQIPPNSFANFVEIISSTMFVKTVFTKPLYEFSFNHIEFPATPGASYSLMMTELTPLKFSDKSCRCGFEVGKKMVKYKAIFRIAGGTQEVRIEPTYGVLENGESVTITLVATPKISDEVVTSYAFERKRSAILQEKLAQLQLERERKLLEKNKIKARTAKKKSKVRNFSLEEKEDDPPPTVCSDEVHLGILDFYPAEIAIWRNIEPYFLNVNFVCRVEYDMQDFWYHPPDVFSLQTVCKVIPPDFIHDQKSQVLDFGQIAVGESKKRIVTIQNIKYNDIFVTTSILRPHGSFSCPNFDSIRLPSESYLKIPITFTPTQDEKIMEYMEIEAESTVYKFVLTAESIQPNISIEPSSKVLRVVSRRGKTVEIPFEIKNDSYIPVTVTLEKVCEIEGKIISPDPPDQDEIEAKGKKRRRDKKQAEVKISSPSKKINEINLSDELTESEIFSIENNFQKTSELSYFDFKEETGQIGLVENSKNTVKILFGQPAELHIYRSKSMSRPNRKNKKLDNRNTTLPTELHGRTFIAKFNVIMGSSVFFRDFIIIGEFK